MNNLILIVFIFLCLVSNAKEPVKATKLYKNKKYGFSFEYPVNFKLNDDSGVGMGNEYVEPGVYMTNSLEVKKKECSKADKECDWPTIIRFAISEDTDGSEKVYLEEKKAAEEYRKKKYNADDRILNIENNLSGILIMTSLYTKAEKKNLLIYPQTHQFFVKKAKR